jgi:hypothetical protein
VWVVGCGLAVVVDGGNETGFNYCRLGLINSKMVVIDSGVAMIKTLTIAIVLAVSPYSAATALPDRYYTESVVCATRPDVSVRDYDTLKIVDTLKKGECMDVAMNVNHPKPEYLAVISSTNRIRVVHKKFVAFVDVRDGRTEEQSTIPQKPILPANYRKALSQRACSYLRVGISPSKAIEYTTEELREYDRFGSLDLTISDLYDLPEKIVRSQMHCVGTQG